jgi:type II secretory pathway pseudopilin PulG
MRWGPECHRQGHAGFTVLELVVVVGLIAVVLAILTLGVRQASDSFSLRRAAAVATSELRRAQANAVAEGATYIVEMVLTSPSGLNVYRTTASAQTCPPGMAPAPPTTTTQCTRTISGEQWPSTVAINAAGTTLPLCASPANPANKCATFRSLGYADAGGAVQLQNLSGTIATVQVTAATGRVSITP